MHIQTFVGLALLSSSAIVIGGKSERFPEIQVVEYGTDDDSGSESSSSSAANCCNDSVQLVVNDLKAFREVASQFLPSGEDMMTWAVLPPKKQKIANPKGLVPKAVVPTAKSVNAAKPVSYDSERHRKVL
jgi:hypothetical protein